MKRWYESLFENYGRKYDSENFTSGTIGECDFIEAELGFDKSKKILDIGCGTGRHSIELTKRGYKITGVDLSDSMLARAREKAESRKLRVEFLKHDARNLPFENKYNAVIMLCEGAFPLMETDEMNYKILENATKALNGSGKLIFTALNGLFPLYHSVDKFCASESCEGNAACRNSTFDLMTFRLRSIIAAEDDYGNKKELACDERYYVPSEITWLLKSLGFESIGIFSARLGAFSRSDILTSEDFEMLVIAER